MNGAEVELWAREVVKTVLAGRRVEDGRVECKSEFPVDHARAARQIAGLANAARSPEVLWLVGLDEDRRAVTGANLDDLAHWWPQVKKQFDGLAPRISIDRRVPVEDGIVVALLFDATEVPFVVPFGSSGARHEVPWREGTATRSARRGDLIDILVPRLSSPAFEVLDAEFSIESLRADIELVVELKMSLYQTAVLQGTATIPDHRCHALVTTPRLGAIEIPSCAFGSPLKFVGGEPSSSSIRSRFGSTAPVSVRYTAHQGSEQVEIDGPGPVRVHGRQRVSAEPFARLTDAPMIEALVTYEVVETGRVGTLESTLLRSDLENDRGKAVWRRAT